MSVNVQITGNVLSVKRVNCVATNNDHYRVNGLWAMKVR